MKPIGNDRYPNSHQPFRSQRLDDVKIVATVNNLATLRARRGTWRLTSYYYSIGVGLGWGFCFFAVSRHEDPLLVFPVGTTPQTAAGEPLPPSIVFYNLGAAGDGVFGCSPGYPVEVDVQDGEYIHFFSDNANVRIRAVMVGELPPRDAEVSDRER